MHLSEVGGLREHPRGALSSAGPRGQVGNYNPLATKRSDVLRDRRQAGHIIKSGPSGIRTLLNEL